MFFQSSHKNIKLVKHPNIKDRENNFLLIAPEKVETEKIKYVVTRVEEDGKAK